MLRKLISILNVMIKTKTEQKENMVPSENEQQKYAPLTKLPPLTETQPLMTPTT